jgi:glutaredoxin 3
MADIKNITIFSTTTCAYCPMVKEWLHRKGLVYEEVMLDSGGEARMEEMINKSGQMNVPVTIVEKNDGSESVVVGYNIAQLAGVVS